MDLFECTQQGNLEELIKIIENNIQNINEINHVMSFELVEMMIS